MIWKMMVKLHTILSLPPKVACALFHVTLGVVTIITPSSQYLINCHNIVARCFQLSRIYPVTGLTIKFKYKL